MQIIIIGNGVTGITAARTIRKSSNHRITVISPETKYFFSRTALMYIYMGHMKFDNTMPYESWFWEKNKIDLIEDRVTEIYPEEHRITLSGGESLNYDKLILATGSLSNKFGWPGQDLEGVQGLYHYQDLLDMEKYTEGIKEAVIVGGGLIGIEMAEMLLSRNIHVTFLVREKEFWNAVLPTEEAMLIGRHIRSHGVDLRLETELKEIRPDEDGRAREVLTSRGDIIKAPFVGLTAGVHPNIAFLKDTGIETDRGILVNEYMETSVPDIYAGGDCAQHRQPPLERRPVEQVWYTGKMMGACIGRNICGEKEAYKPGIWFNSAKFFDVEYQTYGTVPSFCPEGVQTFYWESSDGRKSFRANFSREDNCLVGVNLMGIRGRHAVYDRWIKEKADIKKVISSLAEANFDPEFFHRYEREIAETFNSKYPELNTMPEAAKA